MPRKRLTEEDVAKLKALPQGKQIDYCHTHQPWLVLRVNYGGAKNLAVNLSRASCEAKRLIQRSARVAGLIEPYLPIPAKDPPRGPDWLHKISTTASASWRGAARR